MGSVGDANYSVPKEAADIFEKEILSNSRIPSLPAEVKEACKHVHFRGNERPSIPINWRFAESVSALKAFEASMLNVLRHKKYGAEYSDVTIDTDHASLFVMSPLISKVVEANGEIKSCSLFDPKFMEEHGFKNLDLHRAGASMQRVLATNIYKTKDGRFYHCHGRYEGWIRRGILLTRP